MHLLAYVYHWDRDTIKYMPSQERREWVECIKLQKEAEKEAMEKNN